MQRLSGYCLTGDVTEQILPVFFGSGSNGKSTYLKAIQNTMGKDFSSAAPNSLLLEKAIESHPTELAGLFGKRMVISTETNDGSRLAEALVKKLTGGDIISARRMREDFWEFSPTHKLILCTNYKPEVRGTDHAIWRRLVLIPFSMQFWNPEKGETGPPELMRDNTLDAKLKSEAEGILAWMVRGCMEWQRGGLRIPEIVRAATGKYQSDSDSIGRFINQKCLIGNPYRVKFSSLYDALTNWCNDSGESIPTKHAVGKYLTNKGLEDKQSGCRWYLGIGLREFDTSA